MAKLLNLNFRQKLAALVMLSTSVALVLASAAFIVFDVLTARARILRALETHADHIANTCTAALRFGDRQTAADALAVLRNEPRVVLAVVYDRSDDVFATYFRAGEDADTSALLPHEYRPKRGEIHLHRDIALSEDVVGGVCILRDLSDIRDRLWYDAGITGAVLLGSLVLAWGSTARFQRVLTEPLNELLRTTDAVTSGKDYSLRARKVSDDELGELTQRFNRMLYEIQRRDDDLRRAGAELESKVAERTAELSEQRTAALDMMQDAQKARRAAEAAEAQLRETAGKLTRSNEELEQFAYIASHDLQEPLRMIASYVQILGKRYQGKLDKNADKFIAYAVDGARRMQQLINDLLQYSRVTMRGKPFERTDVEQVLAETLRNLQVSLRESHAKVTHDALPTVLADGVQLAQLLQNLIGNAIKYRGEARPKVHVSARQSRGEWIFSVRDNGIGVEPKYAEQIFVIFERLHTERDYPGTGIGLAVCKRIVERHGGRIWMESEHGNGSTFFFSLPAQNSETEDV